VCRAVEETLKLKISEIEHIERGEISLRKGAGEVVIM
jgi:hypothetical protein